MARLGAPLDLSRYDGRAIKNRVRKVGIELEGAWKKLPTETRLEHDGSIRFPEAIMRVAVLGELPSPPLEIAEWEGWIKAYYPHFVNESCGMHVHLSFSNALTYQRIMDPSYPATIIACVSKWAQKQGFKDSHCIWERLAGNSTYCQHKFFADEQAAQTRKDHDRGRNGNRYTVVNYSYNRYGTAECRLLPMMEDAPQAINAIKELISITNRFLVASSVREKKLVVDASDKSGDILEEYRIQV